MLILYINYSILIVVILFKLYIQKQHFVKDRQCVGSRQVIHASIPTNNLLNWIRFVHKNILI